MLPDGVTTEGLSQLVDKCFHVVVLAMAEQSAAFHTSVVHEISNLDEELSSDLWTEDLDYVIRRSVSEVKILQLKTEKSILCDLQVASNKEQLLTQLSQVEIEIETEKPTTWGEDVQMETNTVRWQRFWEIAYREAEALKIQSFVEISDGEDGEDGEDEEDESPLDRGDRGAMEREEGSSYVGEIRGGTVTEEEGAELDEVEVEVEEDEMSLLRREVSMQCLVLPPPLLHQSFTTASAVVVVRLINSPVYQRVVKKGGGRLYSPGLHPSHPFETPSHR